VDAEVSRLKFGREVEYIRTHASDFVAGMNWEVARAEHPVFSVVFAHPKTGRRVEFRFTCDDWDDLPPSLSLFDPDTGDELGWDRWPQQGWSAGPTHPTTGKPFLCLPGIREYHTHTSHLNDPWSGYRNRDSYKLRFLVHRVQQRFGVTNG
jgi:hypothetical protein